MTIDISADPESLAHRVADWLLGLAQAKQGRFAVALSGGSTPKRLYQLLGAAPYVDRFPWARTHWFWGDERFVARDDPRSNYRMTVEAMLGHVPAPPENVHGVETDAGNADTAAAAYEATLRAFYGAEILDPARPLFDVNLLGLGPDGHTASLFPGTEALRERVRWAVPVSTKAQPEPRVTLTYPVLDSSAHVAFLIAGAEKRPMLERLRKGDPDVPAAGVRPVGTLHYFVDAAAAGPEAVV